MPSRKITERRTDEKRTRTGYGFNPISNNCELGRRADRGKDRAGLRPRSQVAQLVSDPYTLAHLANAETYPMMTSSCRATRRKPQIRCVPLRVDANRGLHPGTGCTVAQERTEINSRSIILRWAIVHRSKWQRTMAVSGPQFMSSAAPAQVVPGGGSSAPVSVVNRKTTPRAI